MLFSCIAESENCKSVNVIANGLVASCSSFGSSAIEEFNGTFNERFEIGRVCVLTACKILC